MNNLEKLYQPTIAQPRQHEFIDSTLEDTGLSLIFLSKEHFSDWLSEIKDISRREGHIEGLAAYKQKVRNFALEILND